MSRIRNVALVHGGFVDGSGWKGVYDILRQEGYSVSVVQNPTVSFEDDVAVTSRVLSARDGPIIQVCGDYSHYQEKRTHYLMRRREAGRHGAPIGVSAT